MFIQCLIGLEYRKEIVIEKRNIFVTFVLFFGGIRIGLLSLVVRLRMIMEDDLIFVEYRV
jgi:hypothetical protein